MPLIHVLPPSVSYPGISCRSGLFSLSFFYCPVCQTVVLFARIFASIIYIVPFSFPRLSVESTSLSFVNFTQILFGHGSSEPQRPILVYHSQLFPASIFVPCSGLQFGVFSYLLTLTHHRFAILVAKFAKILQSLHVNHKIICIIQFYFVILQKFYKYGYEI